MYMYMSLTSVLKIGAPGPINIGLIGLRKNSTGI